MQMRMAMAMDTEKPEISDLEFFTGFDVSFDCFTLFQARSDYMEIEFHTFLPDRIVVNGKTLTFHCVYQYPCVVYRTASVLTVQDLALIEERLKLEIQE